jgi:hypothetical protein
MKLYRSKRVEEIDRLQLGVDRQGLAPAPADD